MPFFGNPLELLLIIVIALIVFGPAKLPEIMGQIGKAVNDFRRATSDLSEEFNKTIQAELQESRSVLADTKAAVTDVHTSVNAAVTGTPAPTLVATPGEIVPTANGTSTEAPPTNGALGEAPKPALAETTPWSWETATPTLAPTPVESSEASAESTAGAPLEMESTRSETPADAPSEPKKAPAPHDELLPPY